MPDSHGMEFEADTRGAELLLADHAKGFDPLFGNPERKIVLAGIDVFFTYLDFLQRVHDIPESSSTHPSPAKRRQQLRDRFAAQIPPEAKALAEFAEDLFSSFTLRL